MQSCGEPFHQSVTFQIFSHLLISATPGLCADSNDSLLAANGADKGITKQDRWTGLPIAPGLQPEELPVCRKPVWIMESDTKRSH